MDDDDFTRIEKALGVGLPDTYRCSVAPFPVAGEIGNSDAQVWDDAEELICSEPAATRGKSLSGRRGCLPSAKPRAIRVGRHRHSEHRLSSLVA